jgi:hypothetical protein
LYDNEDIQRQQITNLLNVLGANPLFAQNIDWTVMLNHVLRLNGFPDPTVVLKKPKGVDVMQSMMASEENFVMASGKPIAPATPEDDYDVHMDMHNELVRARPDLYQIVGMHMYSHDQVKAGMIQQQAMQQAAAGGGPQGLPSPQNGPGSGPPGASGGQAGVNPNRQPDANSQQGLGRQQARLTPGAKR